MKYFSVQSSIQNYNNVASIIFLNTVYNNKYTENKEASHIVELNRDCPPFFNVRQIADLFFIFHNFVNKMR